MQVPTFTPLCPVCQHWAKTMSSGLSMSSCRRNLPKVPQLSGEHTCANAEYLCHLGHTRVKGQQAACGSSCLAGMYTIQYLFKITSPAPQEDFVAHRHVRLLQSLRWFKAIVKHQQFPRAAVAPVNIHLLQKVMSWLLMFLVQRQLISASWTVCFAAMLCASV